MNAENEDISELLKKPEYFKFHSNPCWIAFIHPYVFVVPNNEKPWEVKLEDINQVSYNHGNLIRVVSKFKTIPGDMDGLVCYDGALALPKHGSFLKKENAINYFNRLFLKLNLNGFYVEYVDHRDVVAGQLHEKWGVTNFEYGNSAPSQLHSKIRSRVTSNFDTIMLSNPRILKVAELETILETGEQILARIPNLSAKFLNIGITEIRYNNWDLVLSNLWISAEQLIDHLWHEHFLKSTANHPAKEITGRKPSLKDDARTWSIAVKQEMLFQMGYISEEILSHLSAARKTRNKLVHEGKGVEKDTALGLFNAVKELLKLVASPLEIKLAGDNNDFSKINRNISIEAVDLFEDWRKLPDKEIVETILGAEVTKNVKLKSKNLPGSKVKKEQ